MDKNEVKFSTIGVRTAKSKLNGCIEDLRNNMESVVDGKAYYHEDIGQAVTYLIKAIDNIEAAYRRLREYDV